MKKFEEYEISYLDHTKELVETLPDGVAETGLGQIAVKLDKLPFKHVRFRDFKKNKYKVVADNLGYSLLQLEFNHKYYKMEKK